MMATPLTPMATTAPMPKSTPALVLIFSDSINSFGGDEESEKSILFILQCYRIMIIVPINTQYTNIVYYTAVSNASLLLTLDMSFRRSIHCWRTLFYVMLDWCSYYADRIAASYDTIVPLILHGCFGQPKKQCKKRGIGEVLCCWVFVCQFIRCCGQWATQVHIMIMDHG